MDAFNYLFGVDLKSFLIIAICILLIAWFVFRELRTWYWKINDIVRLLERIDRKLDIIVERNSIEDAEFVDDDYFREPDAVEKVIEEPIEDDPTLQEEIGVVEALKELLNKKIF